MKEGLHPPEDYSEHRALAQRVARIFGYDGLNIEVQPGAGWQTIRTDRDITLVVDPTMLQPQTIKDASGADLPPDTQPPEQYAVYGNAHELGHIDDFMQPEAEDEFKAKVPPSEHFFWNLLDDGVINNRLRNVPLLNSLTDEIYRDMLFPRDDYRHLPKHVQFAYGWLFRTVIPKRVIALDEKVTAALDGLKAVKIQGNHYDLYRTLVHPATSYGRRHEIAREHVLPIYNDFLEEDRQNKQDQDQSYTDSSSQASDQSEQSSGGSSSESNPQNQGRSENDDQGSSESDNESTGQGSQAEPGLEEQAGQGEDSSAPQNWDEIYESYKKASHCGQHEHHDDASDSDAGGDDHGNESTDPHRAIREAAEALRDIQQQATSESGQEQGSPEVGSATDQAGSIAAELELSPDDATAYQQVVERYRREIQEVAKVLQQLAIPSIEYMSPRYRRQPAANGLKLSSRELFQVVVAHHSDIDPVIWKPVETVARKEGLTFNGLDIHLVGDASVSMEGEKAQAAAACSVMLMEGLASARRMIERYNPSAPKPDVRLQLVLFGSSMQLVTPLSHEIQPKDKGVAFTTIRDAASGATYVADALDLTIANAKTNPERTQLVYLITDGSFSDTPAAKEVLKQAGSNYFLYQYVLLSPSTSPIVPTAQHLSRPDQLPPALNKQLKALAARFQLQ